MRSRSQPPGTNTLRASARQVTMLPPTTIIPPKAHGRKAIFRENFGKTRPC